MNEQTKRAADLSRPGEIIDFTSLARVLWQRRVFIVSGFIILTVIGALIFFLAPRRYLCEAFFQVGGLDVKNSKRTNMSIPVFKQGELLLNNIDHMHALMAMDPGIGKEERESFLKRNRNGKNLHKYFAPVTNYTRMIPLSENNKSSVIGFKLGYEGKTRKNMEKYVKFFADYIRSTYLALALDEHIQINFAAHGRTVKECENREIYYHGLLERLNKKKDKLEVFAKRFPRFSSADEQQIKKLPKASAHYMSPSLRLSSVDSQLMSIYSAAEENAAKKESSTILLQFYSQARQLQTKLKNNGIELLVELHALRTRLFAKKLQRAPAEMQAENTLSMDLQRFQDIYFGVFQFLAGPSVSLKNTLPTRICLVAWIAVFSLIFMIGAALLLRWLGRNLKKTAD